MKPGASGNGKTPGLPRSAGAKAAGIHGQRLIAVFLFGCLLFNYPLLYLFNIDFRMLGVPLLYVYAFAAWGLLILLTAAVLEHGRD